MSRFWKIFFFWPVGYGWLWGRKPQIPDEIPGFTRDPIPRPDPFGIRPEMAGQEIPIATFRRDPIAEKMRPIERPPRASDDEGDSGLLEAAALAGLMSTMGGSDGAASEALAAPSTEEWKGEGGEFSGGGASGSWEPEDPIDNHVSAASNDSDISNSSDNADVSDNSDSSDDNSGSSSDDNSDSSSDSGSDSSSDSGSDSSDSGSDSSSSDSSSSDSGSSDS